MQNQKNNKFKIVQMAPQNTNSVVVSDGANCVIFDPWGSVVGWEKYLSEHNLKPEAIYITHGHPDHIAAAPKLAEKYNVPWYLHSGDFRLVGWGNDLLAYFNLPPITAQDVRPTVLEVKEYRILGNTIMQVWETPGHSAGGVSYYFPNDGVLLIGDTLFQDSVGRYDLPGGNLEVLKKSISNIYNKNLPNDVMVVHGHGMDTTIGFLKANNPFFK